MLHTTLDKVKGSLPIDALETDSLPHADYYALGHIHVDFQYENFVYPGPLFPNNFQELEDLNNGSFYIVNTELENPLKKIELKIKDTIQITVEVNDAITSTEKIISELGKQQIEDKIILLRIKGDLEKGSNSDIKFNQIEDFVKSKKAYFLLKNTHELNTKEVELEFEAKDSENIEDETIALYEKSNPSDFNSLVPSLMNALSIEKQEDEKSVVFENRLIGEVKKILKF
jgi:DNA repair exonuclease SbcCD nuclease subunit